MCSLNQAELGLTTFFASSYPSESCGSNGLPLTPNSIKILGRGQKLKTISHPHLCKYIKIARGKYERLIVISEYFRNDLSQESKVGRFQDPLKVAVVAHQTLQGLAHINNYGLVHRTLSPQNIRLDLQGNVKITKFGLFYITDHGNDVAFPIGVPKYLAPEVLAAGPSIMSSPYAVEHHFNKACPLSGPKVDVWSLGIILTELCLEIDLWANLTLKEIFSTILSFLHPESSESVLEKLAKSHDVVEKLQEIPLELRSFLDTCLDISPRKRPLPKELLSHQLFLGFKESKLENNKMAPFVQFTDFPSMQLRCLGLELLQNGFCTDDEDYVSQRSMEEVLYLWQLAGGDVNAELKKQGLAKSRPPICTLPNVVIEDGEQFGLEKDRIYLLNETVIILHLDQLRQRLSSIEPSAFFPLLEDGSRNKGLPVTVSSTDLAEAANLPLIIRETDIEYQLHRILLYERLLKCYPYKKQLIWKEARVDTPPLYRSLVWAALLEIEGDVQAMYDAIDKETPTSTDRQIEVDIPRCHQYDELLSSPEGHSKFKRLLKAWVISHPQYVYWQGLDSLCAPFLYLNFNNEALAYSCLAAFIPKYLHMFFLKDNSPVIQEYLAVFSHLIAFHDPVLANHLDNIGFIPELYSIPWFLTMYTHVFPLHKIFHLWDTLLLGNSSFPLFIGVAILQQLKESLLSFGFNECILLFSDMPEIDIEKCVTDSIKIYCCTPKSATYRQHARHPGKTQNGKTNSAFLQDYNDKPLNELSMDPLPLDQLKSEVSPRISAEDLLELCELTPIIQSENIVKKIRQSKPKILIIDIRSNEEFVRGAIPDSLNIPFKTAFVVDNLAASAESKLLHTHKGRLTVIVGPGSIAGKFATKLVRLGFPRVCVLHRGIDVLKSIGILAIPPAEI